MFDDIRPYNNAEVRPVLDRIIRDPELLRAVHGMLLPKWTQRCAFVLNPLIIAYLRWQTRSVQSVDALQRVMEKYLLRVIDSSTSGFTVSGLEYVPRDKACLYIGNHRDIALDPAFMSYALKRSGLRTCRVAIGDNLLSKPFVADLMRLNKCFIVKRTASGPRQLLKRYQQLSQFIQHSVLEEHQSVWIAQREGRAKNGDDKTEAAILKMLYMAGKKQDMSMSEYFTKLTLIPVSISYEYDPCDGLKALELQAKQTRGDYEKGEHEDIASIARGVRGQKGRVHVSFSPALDFSQLSLEKAGVEEIAQCIDAQIHNHYRLHPSNVSAFNMLDQSADDAILTEVFGPVQQGELMERKALEFQRRLDELSADVKRQVIDMYAVPVSNKLAAAER